MASSSSMVLFFTFNILFFSMVINACDTCPKPKPKPRPTPCPTTGGSGGIGPGGPVACPRDALQLGVCAKVLTLVNATVGDPPVKPCCSLLDGLVDLEVAACFCTVIKANILGLHLNLPIDLSLLVNVCGNKVPRNFQCA